MNLSFQFASMAEFFTMNGHGPYVWAAYALTVSGLLYLVLKPWQRQRQFKAEQQMILKQTVTQETSTPHAPD